MDNYQFIVAVSMAIVGIIFFSLSILATRKFNQMPDKPLAGVLIASGILALVPAIESLTTVDFFTHFLVIVFPAWLLLVPYLWRYVISLTEQKITRQSKSKRWQRLSAAIAVIISTCVVMLSDADRAALFVTNDSANSLLSRFTQIAIFIAAIYWLVSTCFYLMLIVKQLRQHRQRLKQYFANLEHKSLIWLDSIITLSVGTWLLLTIMLATEALFELSVISPNVEVLLYLTLIWAFSLFAVTQPPVFSIMATDTATNEVTSDTLANTATRQNNNEKAEKSSKYQRSALSKDQAKRIADKLNNVMQNEKLFFDSSLSLPKLANHMGISANYISQTLNESLDTNFFDFVNGWRIKEAKARIVESNDTVLAIALDVGFNARSSFYKTFKKETGMTPVEYRKSSLTQNVD
ncbi:helix-turn-helix domain-containing protein [Thalassotalea fusca]